MEKKEKKEYDDDSLKCLPKDEVYDEGEYAQWQQLRESAYIHAKASQLNAPEFDPDFDGKHCIECGDEIPTKRLALHKIRCVCCQNELEEEKRIRGNTHR